MITDAQRFNDEYPIGTPVIAFPGSREGRAILTRTRTPAWTLCGQPVVSVEGYSGGIALTHIEDARDASSDRDALARQIDAVRKLHTPRQEQVVTADCSIGECDHEDECPTVPLAVCAECWRVADEADTYFAERGVEHVAYPCPTIRALDGGL